MEKIYYGCHNFSGGTWLINVFLCLDIKNVTPSFYTWTKRKYSDAYSVEVHDLGHASRMPIFKSKKFFFFDDSVELHGIGHYPEKDILEGGYKTVYISRDLRDAYYRAFVMHSEMLEFFEIEYQKFPEHFSTEYEHTVFSESVIDMWITKQQIWENAEKKYPIFRPRFEDCKHSWQGVQQILDFLKISRSREDIQAAIDNANSYGKDRGCIGKWKDLPPEMLAYITQRAKPYLEKRGYSIENAGCAPFTDKYKDAHTWLFTASARNAEGIYIADSQLGKCISSDKIEAIITYTHDMYVMAVANILYAIHRDGNIKYIEYITSFVKITFQLFLYSLQNIIKEFPEHAGLRDILVKISVLSELLNSDTLQIETIIYNTLKKDPQLVHELNLEVVRTTKGKIL